MKKTLSAIALSLLSLSAFAQAPILRGPGTTNTPAAWTNVVRLTAWTPGLTNQWKIDATNAAITQASYATNKLDTDLRAALAQTNQVTAGVTNQWKIDATNAAITQASYPTQNLAAVAFNNNGVVVTNILEKNIVSTTNIWGNQVVTFGGDRMILTNMAGDLTITGVTGFVTTNLNWTTVSLNPNGATRTLVVPTDWFVSGFTNATTASITNGTWAFLDVRMAVGIFTNAILTIFQ